MIVAIVIMFIILMVLFSIGYYFNLKRKNKEMYIDIDYKNIETILDNIIEDEFVQYKILNISYDDSYISEEEQKTLITDITVKIYKRIMASELLKYQLGMLYNIKNKDELINSIMIKVSIHSIAFVKDSNRNNK